MYLYNTDCYGRAAFMLLSNSHLLIMYILLIHTFK